MIYSDYIFLCNWFSLWICNFFYLLISLLCKLVFFSQGIWNLLYDYHYFQLPKPIYWFPPLSPLSHGDLQLNCEFFKSCYTVVILELVFIPHLYLINISWVSCFLVFFTLFIVESYLITFKKGCTGFSF